MPLSNRWQRCLVGYLVIFCFCQTIAKNLPDSCNDRKNYLWREECHFTGDRQGPIFDRKQKNITHHSPPQPIFSSILNGGSLDISSRSEEDTTEVTPYDRVFQWRRKRGKITINLGEPKEEETITVRTVLLGTVDSATAANQTATVVVPLTQQLEPSPHDPCNQNIEIALSIEPSSCVRLVQTSANASVVFFSAFAVTLRLLAPMIVARKLLATLGYICYDRYYGRYLRTTYNNKLKHLEEYEIISGLRACGRITVQLLAMGVVGKSLIIILDHSPCFMAPRICELWYALVWIVGVLVAARVADAGIAMFCPHLQIFPIESRNVYSPSRVFSRPWHLLQWIKDPKEWINNIATKRHSGDAPFQPDALLFPSNWPPLHVLSCVSIIRAICMNMAKKRNSGSLMRNTCVQLALYEEWNRVFLKEKRVALGAVVHIVLFLALLNLVFVITVVDGVAAVLMTPTVLACLVSSWMNILLFKERLLLQKKSSRRLTRGDGHGKNRSAIQF